MQDEIASLARLRHERAARLRVRRVHGQPVARRIPTSTSATTRSGRRRPTRCGRAGRSTGCRTRSKKATPRSTVRRSTSTSATRSAAPGSSARSSSTSTIPSGSISSTSAPTTPATARSCCTARCSARIERFFGVLLEHYAGAFPTWMAPVQARVLPVAEAHQAHAAQVVERLVAEGFRVDIVDANDQLGKRIRTAKLEKLPYVLVVGDDDVAANTVGVNPRGGDVERGVAVDEFIQRLARRSQRTARRHLTAPSRTGHRQHQVVVQDRCVGVDAAGSETSVQMFSQSRRQERRSPADCRPDRPPAGGRSAPAVPSCTSTLYGDRSPWVYPASANWPAAPRAAARTGSGLARPSGRSWESRGAAAPSASPMNSIISSVPNNCTGYGTAAPI